MRLFWAIDLPEKIKEELGELQNEIKNSFPMEAADSVAKWVALENLHITLLFLGEVEERHLPEIIETGKNAFQDQAPLSLHLQKICYGPKNQIPPRFVWAELAPNLSLQKITRAIGERQNFFGHITLGRVREWVWKRIDPEERPNIEKELGLKFIANSVELMESRLKRTGPKYTVLQSFPLT